MKLDIVFDTVCPWCFIGKRRLERALKRRPTATPEIRWRPFLLNPDMPSTGIDRTAYLIKKFGSETRVRRVYGAIGEAGQSVEIDFAFDRIRRTPNSVPSHRLIRYAARHMDPSPIVEELFQAYFMRGADIGDTEFLADLAAQHGMSAKSVASFLRSDEEAETVYEENARAHRLGINGVPAFSFEGHMIISGAQEPEVLVRMIDAASAEARLRDRLSA